MNSILLDEIYDKFEMPGVDRKDIPLLFNTSNFRYFSNQVWNMRKHICPFCDIDPSENEIIPISNPSWLVLRNKIAPRSGQIVQFVIPFKRRHVESFSEIGREEKNDFWDLQDEIDCRLREKHGITGSVWVIRDGDEFFHAGSVRHRHANLHIPTGIDKVQITLGKDLKSRREKLAALLIFKKMFIMREAGNLEPWRDLPMRELKLVIDDIEPPAPAEKFEL